MGLIGTSEHENTPRRDHESEKGEIIHATRRVELFAAIGKLLADTA